VGTPETQSCADDSIVSALEHVRPRAAAVLARYRIPPQDAEDLVQDAALCLVSSWPKVTDAEGWLLGVLKHRCANYWRARRRRLCESVDEVLLEAFAEPQPSGTPSVELAEDLGRAVAKLPSRCQSLFRLRYHLGCTPREAAQRLGYSATSISNIAIRCLTALGRCLVAAGFFEEQRRA
jgi:RNA polymerase sigma-70 factor (ECF subfamily)